MQTPRRVMCGLAGIYAPAWSAERRERMVGLMLDSLRARGPDGSRVVSVGSLSLGFSRLRVVGREGVDQPIEVEGVVAATNGEIYNHRALRSLLPAGRRPPATVSDCSVVAPLYLTHGRDFVQHLDGIFAGVIFDTRADRLMLFRDHLGVKPLHWYSWGDGAAFASSTSALGVCAPLALNRSRVRLYLATGYVEGSQTLIEGVHDVPAGVLAVLDRSTSSFLPERWYSLPATVNGYPSPSLRVAVESAVESETPDEGDVHVCLSGGLDSTIVTLIAAQKRPDLTALTVTYEGMSDDPDRVHARQVASQMRIRHQEVCVSWRDYADVMQSDWKFDQPLSDPNALAFALLARAVSDNGGRVLLSGDGADELFCGYPYYANATLAWPRGWLHAAAFTSMSDDRDRAFVGRLTGKRDRRQFTRVRHAPLTEMQVRDLRGWLEANLLEKSDRFAMAHSVEVRVPFLRRSLVAAALALPAGAKTSAADRRGKFALRNEFADVVPRHVLDRPKVGFPCPIGEWLRGPLGERAAREAVTSVADEWDPDRERRLWDEHRSGEFDWGDQLWRLVVLRAWWRTAVRAARPQPPGDR